MGVSSKKRRYELRKIRYELPKQSRGRGTKKGGDEVLKKGGGELQKKGRYEPL